ncbi:hypothetical protein [Sporosarcina sp. NPDC096371]
MENNWRPKNELKPKFGTGKKPAGPDLALMIDSLAEQLENA